MTVRKLKEFLNKYNDNDNIEFGIVNQGTGQWYDLDVDFLCNKEQMGNGCIGIQFEENTDYINEKTSELINEIRKEVVDSIDKFTY